MAERNWLFWLRAVLALAIVVAAVWVLVEALFPMIVLLLVVAAFLFTRTLEEDQ